jgi:hypothetical protein
LSNLPLVMAHPKSPEKRKKAKISVGFVENFGGVTPNVGWGRNAELEKKGHTSPPLLI